MTTEIWIALISLAGSLLGTFAGIVTANKLTQYRIDKLEENIKKLDTLDERMDKVETIQAVQQSVIAVNTEAIKELKTHVTG